MHAEGGRLAPSRRSARFPPHSCDFGSARQEPRLSTSCFSGTSPLPAIDARRPAHSSNAFQCHQGPVLAAPVLQRCSSSRTGNQCNEGTQHKSPFSDTSPGRGPVRTAPAQKTSSRTTAVQKQGEQQTVLPSRQRIRKHHLKSNYNHPECRRFPEQLTVRLISKIYGLRERHTREIQHWTPLCHRFVVESSRGGKTEAFFLSNKSS